MNITLQITHLTTETPAALSEDSHKIPSQAAFIDALDSEPIFTSDMNKTPALNMEAPVPPTKKKRTLMGFIRAGWFYIFTVLGGVLDYLIQKYTETSVPPGVVGTIIGGALYGSKRAFFPDTTL